MKINEEGAISVLPFQLRKLKKRDIKKLSLLANIW